MAWSKVGGIREVVTKKDVLLQEDENASTTTVIFNVGIYHKS
jgi:hypothetical protein